MKKKTVKMIRTTITLEPGFYEQAQAYANSLPEYTSFSALIRHLLHVEMKKAASCKTTKN